MRDLFWLTDKQMRRIEPYFLLSHGIPRINERWDLRYHAATIYVAAMLKRPRFSKVEVSVRLPRGAPTSPDLIGWCGCKIRSGRVLDTPLRL